MAWKSEPAHFSLDDGASSDQSAHASMLDVLSDLVDLEEVGEVDGVERLAVEVEGEDLGGGLGEIILLYA